jgi:nucleoside-diphosphate-sugar epimerase
VAAVGPWGLPSDALDAACEAAEADLAALRGARILVTGGTGFLGRWISATLARDARRHRRAASVVIVSRRPKDVPLAGHPQVEVVAGDVRRLHCLDRLGAFDAVIHGAASSSAAYGIGEGEPRAMAMTILEGTRAALEVAARSRARVLFLSSGAVYGPQWAPVAEDAPGAPDPLDPRSAYGQAKRLAENLCAATTAAGDASCTIARCFSFVGAGIPLRGHYAAGNFLASALEGRPIVVEGDGRPLRSYLYCAELPEWCLALLVRGRAGQAYNVGSPEAISIYDLARRCSRLRGAHLEVEVRTPPRSGPAPCYVPVTKRCEDELGLVVRTPLDTALSATLDVLAQGRRAS